MTTPTRRAIVTGLGIGAAALAAGGCDGSSGPSAALVVTPPTGPADGPLAVRLSGLKPSAQVRITATVAGPGADRQEAWTSSATFAADRTGRVDLARQAPVDGSYGVADPAGLLWMLQTDDDRRPAAPLVADGHQRVTLTATVGDRRVATAAVRRDFDPPGIRVIRLTKADDGLVGEYHPPSAAVRGRGPAVLLFGGSEGGLIDYVAAQAGLLAAHGHPTLALAYFRAPGLPDVLAGIPLEYFATGLRWLARRDEVDPGRIVVAGDSRGSEAALLLGVHFPDLVHAVVAGVPSSTVHQGLVDAAGPVLDRSPWTLGGRPLPYTRQFLATAPTDVPAAVIPVERIRGPVMTISGGADRVWISSQFAQAIADRRRGRNVADVALEYPLAGHLVGLPVPNLPLPTRFGGRPADNAAAIADAWPKYLRFVAGV